MRFQIDESLNGFDRYQVNVEPNSITFAGSDELGLIHAIYSFSGEILGIDPCIYFTGILPKQEKQIPLELGTIESKPYTFKHRVMFVNDEDLVIGFQMQKHSYGMNMEFMAKLFETMLRLEMTEVFLCIGLKMCRILGVHKKMILSNFGQMPSGGRKAKTVFGLSIFEDFQTVHFGVMIRVFLMIVR